MITSGSVGKLKLSSEMKEKLEAAMGSRKSSIRSTKSGDQVGVELKGGVQDVRIFFNKIFSILVSIPRQAAIGCSKN